MLALLAAGCSGSLEPQPVAIDRAECARCRMLISSDATGGQIVSARAEPRFYDDIGCLAADAPHDAAQTRIYVRTTAGTWMEARAAAFAEVPAANTPMGSNILAFASESAARAAVAGGRVLTWPDVVRTTGEAQP